MAERIERCSLEQCATVHLFAVFRRSWGSSPGASPLRSHLAEPSSSRAYATWPAEKLALVPRLWQASLRTASRFSGSGPAAVPGCHAVPTANLRPPPARWDASSLGPRSMLRGEAVALFYAGLPLPLVTQALRHASARSDGSHILELS